MDGLPTGQGSACTADSCFLGSRRTLKVYKLGYDGYDQEFRTSIDCHAESRGPSQPRPVPSTPPSGSDDAACMQALGISLLREMHRPRPRFKPYVDTLPPIGSQLCAEVLPPSLLPSWLSRWPRLVCMGLGQ